MKIDLEYFRLIAVSAFSPILAYFTPTKGFFIALVVMFAFNVIAGMRADGVSIVRCNNFSMRKFKNSLAELLLYIVLLYAVYIAISQCGDLKGALMAMKSLTYILLYVYLCNGLKNYVKAYPQNIGLRIIYHAVRLEFTRIMPSYWKPIIERCKEEMENKKVGQRMKQVFIPILDNGHGIDTAGKRSPVWDDGTQLFEWEFNRDIVKRVSSMLEAEGIRYRILVPEKKDVSLSARCKRANAIYSETSGKCFLISVHANAGGGTGWEAYTSVGQTKADLIATELYKEAEKEFAPDGWKIRKDTSDGDPDKESQFYILKHTKCPAVLVENFFMDTRKDCAFIQSEDGRNRVSKVIFETIKSVCYGRVI